MIELGKLTTKEFGMQAGGSAAAGALNYVAEDQFAEIGPFQGSDVELMVTTVAGVVGLGMDVYPDVASGLILGNVALGTKRAIGAVREALETGKTPMLPSGKPVAGPGAIEARYKYGR